MASLGDFMEGVMAEQVNVKNIGLRGVTVADTKVSFIDGDKGVLIYRGYRIEDLAANASFMEVVHLLLNGDLPTKSQLTELEDRIRSSREIPAYIFECMKQFPRTATPMDVLQAVVPLLAMDDPDLEDESREADYQRALRLVSRLPVLAAAWQRIRNGHAPLVPDDALSHAANFLWLFHGEKPDEDTAKDLDTCLTLHADHTFNASTFACREVVSTKAHMYAGVTAGIGALSGSLHGGANARVMRMLLELESETDIHGWVKNRLDSGERIMGMGHAVYRTMDPRAKFLKEMGIRLGRKMGNERLPALSAEVETYGLKEFAARGKTNIQPNVDFFSAPVYHLMGIPGDMMTPIFAISRVSGWCAHIIEERFAEAQEKTALYRPKAEYVGQYCGLMGCEYKAEEERG
jgi:citrate synthase